MDALGRLDHVEGDQELGEGEGMADGAAGGAVIGALTGNWGKGAAIGALAGGTGGLIYDQTQKR